MTDHTWSTLAREQPGADGTLWHQMDWCQSCGSVREVFCRRDEDSGRDVQSYVYYPVRRGKRGAPQGLKREPACSR